MNWSRYQRAQNCRKWKSPCSGPGELLYGVPAGQIVNAAFTRPGPYGGRFHGPGRGAWYAGVGIETSIAEASFHAKRFLENGRIPGAHPFDYVDFGALILSVCFTAWAIQNSTLVCGRTPFRSATPHRRRSRTSCYIKARMGLYTRVFAIPLALAQPAFGQLWCISRAVPARTASQSRVETRQLQSNRFLLRWRGEQLPVASPRRTISA